MKIVDVKTFVVGSSARGGGRNWVFLKLITDEGLEGIGECNMSFGREQSLVQLIKDRRCFSLIFNYFPVDNTSISLHNKNNESQSGWTNCTI